MTGSREEYIPALGLRVLTPFYDLVQRWLVRDWRFKAELIERAQIGPGQRVLDLGCGTGTLAIMAKRAQPDAEVVGLDADPQMLKVARAKAARAAVPVQFDQGMAFRLPYPDASIDRVLSSLMIHHLKSPDKLRAAAEIHRVLKPGGQLHVIDFGKPRSAYARLLGWALHEFEEADDNVEGRLPGIFAQPGLRVEETGDFMTFFGSLTFLSGRKPAA